jgi:cytochrome c-type biogenesis protein CcmE
VSIDAPAGASERAFEAESTDAGSFDAEPPAPRPSRAEAAVVATARRRRRTATPAQRRRMWVVGVVILAAIGFLLYKGITSAIVFYKTANEAIAQRAQLGNSDFQLEGTVVHGSVQHEGGDVYRFVVESSGVTVSVENTGYPPQMFRPGLPVVLVGHFVGSGDLFASDQIMVKHSQSYVAVQPSQAKSSSGSSP